LRFPAVSTQKLKIVFNALACPVISTVAVYNDPELYKIMESAEDMDKNRIDIPDRKLISPQSLEASLQNENGKNYLKIEVGTPLVVDLGKTFRFGAFSYTPVAEVQSSNVSRYNLYISADGKEWTKLMDNARFNNIANNPVRQYVKLPDAVDARYVKLEPLEIADGGSSYFVAGLDLYR
jgi:hypothetical protein